MRKVGHNSLTVEKMIIEEELGLKQPIPLERMEDTTIAGIWTKDVIG